MTVPPTNRPPTPHPTGTSQFNSPPRPASSYADVVPLVACVAAGCLFAVYKGVEHFRNPDVLAKPASRSKTPWERDHGETGLAWRERTLKHYRHTEQGPLSAFEVFTPQWWKMRAEVHEDPHHHTRGGAAVIE